MLKFVSRSLVVTRRCAPLHPCQCRLFSTARPFRILGLQQIAVGGLEKEPLTNLWVNVFGLSKVDSFVSVSENVDEDILSLGEPPYAVEVDLMTPLDADKSPKVRRRALHSRAESKNIAQIMFYPGSFSSPQSYWSMGG
jgi:hypothetical protein